MRYNPKSRNHRTKKRSLKAKRTAKRRSKRSMRGRNFSYNPPPNSTTDFRGGMRNDFIPNSSIIVYRDLDGDEEAVPTVMTKADMDRQKKYP